MSAPVRLSVMGAGLIGKRHIEHISRAAGGGAVVDRRSELGLQIANFCAIIRGMAEPIVSGREGLSTLRAIDAIKRAAESGAYVSV